MATSMAMAMRPWPWPWTHGHGTAANGGGGGRVERGCGGAQGGVYCLLEGGVVRDH